MGGVLSLEICEIVAMDWSCSPCHHQRKDIVQRETFSTRNKEPSRHFFAACDTTMLRFWNFPNARSFWRIIIWCCTPLMFQHRSMMRMLERLWKHFSVDVLDSDRKLRVIVSLLLWSLQQPIREFHHPRYSRLHIPSDVNTTGDWPWTHERKSRETDQSNKRTGLPVPSSFLPHLPITTIIITLIHIET